ncbi:Fungal-trans domain-containing protein [Mycena venus]|uniref:Fungal-trans domain-containing protein n=1 Tax=Mycena venus TaxID=2733690 RepID=A0A8H6XVZ5_9AGAR|nr:Fungal-trans domain-containing protein [Mycena venus]
MPVLHRPSFERSVREGLHLTDMQFGGLLLSVLAVASWYSKDPRVFVDGDTSLSAGWLFYKQIWTSPKKFEPTISEVQMYCLLTLYTCGVSGPQVSWMYLAIGICCLRQLGEYRRKPEGHMDPEDELWKRAFWSFAALERMVCPCFGRRLGLHVEECDVEPPLEVDDECWDQEFALCAEKDPTENRKPSQVSFFVCDSRLGEIWGDATRRLYASKKAKTLMGWESLDWEQRTVADFDSIMNDFLDSIPTHLRWDPDSPPQGTFFDQSAILHVTYNYILIAVGTNPVCLATC